MIQELRSNEEEVMSQALAALIEDGEWPERNAKAFVRARFVCEYCGLDFLASIEAYKTIEIDHINPALKGGAREHIDNIAIACRHCNCSLKNRWNPALHAPPLATRDELIGVVKQRCVEQRKKRQARLSQMRNLVAYKSA
jgi:5-methylcytosine-specific restriction endonuclease McrA